MRPVPARVNSAHKAQISHKIRYRWSVGFEQGGFDKVKEAFPNLPSSLRRTLSKGIPLCKEFGRDLIR
jgi:hypothetical protein